MALALVNVMPAPKFPLDESMKESVDRWGKREVLLWAVDRELPEMVAALWRRRCSGSDLLKLNPADFDAKELAPLEENEAKLISSSFFSAVDQLKISESDAEKLGNRASMLAARTGWDFVKNFNMWAQLLHAERDLYVLDELEGSLAQKDNAMSIIVLVISTLATIWSVSEFAQSSELWYAGMITSVLSGLVTLVSGYATLSGTSAKLGEVRKSIEHQRAYIALMYEQLRRPDNERKLYSVFVEEVERLAKETADVPAAQALRCVKTIKRSSPELYQRMWGRFPGAPTVEPIMLESSKEGHVRYNDRRMTVVGTQSAVKKRLLQEDKQAAKKKKATEPARRLRSPWRSTAPSNGRFLRSLRRSIPPSNEAHTCKSGGDTDADIKTFEKYLFTSNFAVELDIDKLDVYAEGMVKNAGYGSKPASEAVMARRASMATVPAFAIGRVCKEDPMAGAHPLLLQQLGESVERQSVDGELTA